MYIPQYVILSGEPLIKSMGKTSHAFIGIKKGQSFPSFFPGFTLALSQIKQAVWYSSTYFEDSELGFFAVKFIVLFFNS